MTTSEKMCGCYSTLLFAVSKIVPCKFNVIGNDEQHLECSTLE